MKYLIESVRLEFGIEAANEVASVTGVVRNKVIARNLFGWRTFIEDVLIDLVQYMIQTEFKYSGGAYVTCGMQSAIDATRYCNAQKRRGNYETISIHLVEEFVSHQPAPEFNMKIEELTSEISALLNKEDTKHINDFLLGKIDRIKADVLKKCRTPEFLDWLQNRKG